MVNFSPHYLLLLAQFFTKTFDSYQVVATCPRPVFGPMAAILAVAAAATAVITPSSTAAVQLRWCSIRIVPWPTVSFCFSFFLMLPDPIKAPRANEMMIIPFVSGWSPRKRKEKHMANWDERESVSGALSSQHTRSPPKKESRPKERRARDESPPHHQTVDSAHLCQCCGGWALRLVSSRSFEVVRKGGDLRRGLFCRLSQHITGRDSALPRREAF